METLVFQDGTELYLYSTAALRLASYLGFPWSLVSVLLLVPRPLRDTVYRFVARHRYDWFGKSETCRLPTPEERGRFLSD